MLRNVVAIVIWSIAVLTVLEALGVNLAPLIAGAGIVGIALGLRRAERSSATSCRASSC